MSLAKRGRFQEASSSSKDEIEENEAEYGENEEEEEYEEEEEGEEDGNEEQDEEEDEEEDEDDEIDNLPVLNSIIKKGEINTGNQKSDDREAIKQELAALSFEELQKLKEKLGTKKFNQTVKGQKAKDVKEVDYSRANKNRPREMSSKSRKIERKVVIQVPKVFRNDPRFDGLCGEYNEKKFNRHYEFIGEIKEEELENLKETLKEETNPRRIDKIKYLIQRLENQIRSEKKRKEEESKQHEERQLQIEAMNEGKSPHFATKAAKKEKMMREKFDKLKSEGKLGQYMAKKRKHNAQRDRKYLPQKPQ